jgi:hypothetical protein
MLPKSYAFNLILKLSVFRKDNRNFSSTQFSRHCKKSVVTICSMVMGKQGYLDLYNNFPLNNSKVSTGLEGTVE